MVKFSDLNRRKISPPSSGTPCVSHRRSKNTKLRSALGCILCSRCCDSKMTNSDISDYTTTNTEANTTQTQVRSGKPDVFSASKSEASSAISEWQLEERNSTHYQHDMVTNDLPASAISMKEWKEHRKRSILSTTCEEEMETTGKNKPSIKEEGYS